MDSRKLMMLKKESLPQIKEVSGGQDLYQRLWADIRKSIEHGIVDSKINVIES